MLLKTKLKTRCNNIHKVFIISFNTLQIKLLQGAAKAYHIESQPRFNQWWESVLVLDEREAFDLSCQIEPNLNGSSGASKEIHKYYKRKANSLGSNGGFHRKNDSIDSRASSSSGSQVI